MPEISKKLELFPNCYNSQSVPNFYAPFLHIWGIGMAQDGENIGDPNAWRGQNLLGFALMEVRDALRKVEEQLAQQHKVHIAYMTSGNIAVFDHDAQRFTDFVAEFNALFGIDATHSAAVTDRVQKFLHSKPKSFSIITKPMGGWSVAKRQ